MTSATKTWDVPVSRRSDGQPVSVRFIEVKGTAAGPVTALVSGAYGDEPAGPLMMLALAKRLETLDLKGSVIIVPAASIPAMEVANRYGPDHFALNRRYPGSPKGPITDQIAHAIINELKGKTDCIIDFHSGAPYFGCWFVYDHGDMQLTASLGLPIVENMWREGQLARYCSQQGIKSFLVEIGRNEASDIDAAVEACLNTLRYRGHLDGALTGPKSVVRMKKISLFTNSVQGAFVGTYTFADIGKTIPPGVLGYIASVTTGEKMEEFVLAAEGQLILANIYPYMMAPGGFPYMVGHVEGSVDRF